MEDTQKNNNSVPCCDTCDYKELWDYIPEDIFPTEATEKGYHKYLRTTGWIEIDRVNENNKAIVDDYIKIFKEKHPEKAEGKTDNQILRENDEIWKKGLYDDLLLNSLKNGDFVLDTYSEDDDKRYKRGNVYAKRPQDLVRQFDVIINCTIFGIVCKPYVVFNVSSKHTWGAEEKHDDYAIEKEKELQAWRRTQEKDTVRDYCDFQIQMFKEGHIWFELKDYGIEYGQTVMIYGNNTINKETTRKFI